GTSFLRVHRSKIVNTDHISATHSRGGKTELELNSGESVEVSRSLRPMVLAALDQIDTPPAPRQ
ncbi:MAG: LytTR family DNA-binding domain-containing protein, partial [Myxococcota bacterium]